MNILFVCLGNICRSPLAEGIARHYAQEILPNLNVDSAGTSSWHSGEAPCIGSINVAKNHGIDISTLRSRKVSVYTDNTFDLIIGLDETNVRDLLSLGFEKSKVLKFGSFGLKNADIPDPYHYKDQTGFERVYGMIEHGVKNLLHHIRSQN